MSVSEAVAAMEEDGFTTVSGDVPTAQLEGLRERMDRDTEELLRYCETIGGNPRERGHLQQGPPPTVEYVFSEVATNELVLEICAKLFGQTPELTFYNGNTNCPGSVRQRLHMDGRHFNARTEPPLPTASVVINIVPGFADESNAAVEVWPGSHRVRTKRNDQMIDDTTTEQQRRSRPPVQVATQPGDILIRDVRLWHRGVPNTTSRPRHMIALIYSKLPIGNKYRLKFERGCEAVLERSDFVSNAAYVTDVSDYLIGPTRRIYESQQKSKESR